MQVVRRMASWTLPVEIRPIRFSFGYGVAEVVPDPPPYKKRPEEFVAQLYDGRLIVASPDRAPRIINFDLSETIITAPDETKRN